MASQTGGNTDNLPMQRVWAWTQCIAIDASVAGTIIRTFRYHAEGERVKTWLYGFLSTLLLFTAAIVSNIESVQQTLNIALDQAYVHVFIPLEALIWMRSAHCWHKPLFLWKRPRLLPYHLHKMNWKQARANNGQTSLRKPQERMAMNKSRTTTNG
jgi:hypothetical protein